MLTKIMAVVVLCGDGTTIKFTGVYKLSIIYMLSHTSLLTMLWVYCLALDECTLVCAYVVVITPLRVLWLVYMHDAREHAAPEGRVRMHRP